MKRQKLPNDADGVIYFLNRENSPQDKRLKESLLILEEEVGQLREQQEAFESSVEAIQRAVSQVSTETTNKLTSLKALGESTYQLLDEHAQRKGDLNELVKTLSEKLEESLDHAIFSGHKERPAQELMSMVDTINEFSRHQTCFSSDLKSFIAYLERQAKRVLHNLGLEEIPVDSDTFDDTFHEALEVCDTTDPERDEKIKTILRSGYQRNGTVYRAVGVSVYKYREERRSWNHGS